MKNLRVGDPFDEKAELGPACPPATP